MIVVYGHSQWAFIGGCKSESVFVFDERAIIPY